MSNALQSAAGSSDKSIRQHGARGTHTVAVQDQDVRVTFAVLAYNQEAYIDAAIQGAMAQEWTNLEIILSDDCSTDSTFEHMQKLRDKYQGPHIVKLNRTATNRGICGHTNAVMELASGDLIILAAGDDVSYPCRTREIASAWLLCNRASGYFYSGYDEMVQNGRVVATHVENVTQPPTTKDLWCRSIIGASEAWSRELFVFFGPLNDATTHEDRSMAVRASLLGGVHYIPKPLVAWRQGGVSWVTPQSRLHARKRNARRYVCDASQSLADLQTALSRGLIDEQAHADLVTVVANRLSVESILLRLDSIPAILGSSFMELLRSPLRMAFVTFKACRIRLPW